MVKGNILSEPGVLVSIVLLRVPDSDFSTIQSGSTAVTSVGDFDSGDDIALLQVDAPPWIVLTASSVAAGPLAVVRLPRPINCLVGSTEREG